MPNLLSTAGRFIAHNPHAATAAGAGLGAAAGLARESMQDGEKNYVAAGLGGALKGGLIGAGVGAGARSVRDTMLLNPQAAGVGGVAKAHLKRMGEGVSNLVQRQVHGVTGYGAKDTAYLDRIGIAGSATSARAGRLEALRAMDYAKHNPAKAQRAIHGASKQLGAFAEEGAVGDRMRELGMTHAPGAVKAFATNPRAASKVIYDQLRLGGGLGVAAGIGAPLAVSGMDLARGDESATGGRSMTEKGFRAAANIGGGLVFGGMPLLSQNVVGQGTEYLAGRAGKLLHGKMNPAPAQIG